MNSEIFYQYNPWWEEAYSLANSIPRDKYMSKLKASLDTKDVIFLTGLRRVGKTTLMKLLVEQLLERVKSPEHIFYVSLDDYALNELSIADIVSEYRQLHRIEFDTKVYLFLDEVAYKKHFRQQLKNLYDKENAKVFASSSNNSIFGDTKGFLTGRERVIEITPLDFDEYLQFNNIKIKQRDQKLLENYFEEYLEHGGMPEYVLTSNREYLTGLVEDILYKDIVAAHAIKNPQIIKDFFMLLMERVGKQISINKIANILKISPDTAKRYLHMFEKAFLIYLVPRYGKTNEAILSPKKVYTMDLGIRNLMTGFRDKGALFENVVYTMIKDHAPRYVYEDGTELDFYTENKVLIEVKYGQELNKQQQKLFDKFKADKKLVVSDFFELDKLDIFV